MNNTAMSSTNYKYLNLLTLFFLAIMLGTYVLAYKMVSVGGYVISSGIFIFPINYAITDIVTEVYGFEETKRLIKNVFIVCFCYATVVPFIAILPAPSDWHHQEEYTYVLGNVFRFFFANTIGMIVGITLNSHLIAKWKKMMNGRHFWLRSIGSSAIGELITSIIADILAFAGTTSYLGVLKLMLGIYSVKFIYSLLLAFPNTLIVLHLKLVEGISLIENKVDINPFLTSHPKLREYHEFN